MIPLHTTYASFPFGVIILVFWALRYAGTHSKGGVRPPMVAPAPGADTWALLFWSVRAIAQLSIAILAWGAWFHDEPFGSELRVVAVLAFGSPFIVDFSIRLGLVRTTYALAWLIRPYGTWSDGSVSTLAYAARALRHARSRDNSAAWLESKLSRVRWRTPRGLLALAELAAARGDDARRRLLIATFDGLEPPSGWSYVGWGLASRSLARQARRAHMADLVEAGRWCDAVPLGATSRDPFAWTLSNALRRLGGGGTVPAWKLRLGAAFAGRATWAYVRAALRSVPIESLQNPFSLTDLSRARPYALTPGELAHAWDVWFADPGTTRAIAERSQAIGCRNTEGGLAVLRGVAAASVVALVEREGGTIGDDGLHRVAVDAVWEHRQSAVVDASVRFPALAFDDMERAWIEWIALKALWREAAMVADRLRRRWLYERCWVRVLNHAVLAHNKHGQPAFASDVYRFLLAEAELLTHSSVDLLEKNVRAAGT